MVLALVLGPGWVWGQGFVASGAAAPESRLGAAEASAVLGSVQGMVTDATEAAVPGAVVSLWAADSTKATTMESAQDGSFVFPSLPAGTYRVSVAREGFGPWRGSAEVLQGAQLRLPGIALSMLGVSSAVEVRASSRDVAEAQMGLEERQRVLGIFPNFYASYAPHAVALSPGEKFRLAWRFTADPVAFAMAGVVAGAEQRGDTFHEYGPGMGGYGKRFGAAYADGFTSTLLGQALLPAVLHQDPRYFVKGTGSAGARILYVLATTVVCKGDNGRWQVNASNMLGNLASAGISNAYYPSAERGAGLVLENALTATAMGAVGGLFQEFVLHRMTPHVPDYAAMVR